MFKPNNKKRKKLRKLVSVVLIVALVFIWTMSNLPRVGKNEFPPKVRETHAAPVQVVLTSAQGSSWDVPSTWDDTNNTVEVIGGGAGGGGGGTGGSRDPGGGGGGGAYAKSSNIDLNPGGTVDIQIGTGGPGGVGANNGTVGGDTWLNGSGGTCSGQSVCGEGGDGGTAGGAAPGTGGAGGTTANSIGAVQEYAGGAGADGSTVGGGGGGAAGLNGIGLDGTGSTGGDGDNSNGGAGGTENNPGGDGTEWTETGSGGGGGGGNKAGGGAGGAAGAGGGGADDGYTGGTGTEGVIIIIYEPLVTTTLTQNDFEWFEDQTTLTLTNVWGNPDIPENGDLTAVPISNSPPSPGDKIRLQINVTVTDADLSAGAQDFILQYKEGTDQDCSTGSWTDVGAISATGVAWRYFDNASLTDGDTQVNQISSSTSGAEGDYVESDPTNTNPNAVTTGQSTEWDFAIESLSGEVTDATSYAFRLIQGGTGYTVNYTAGDCPTLEMAPGMSDLMRHGNFFVSGLEKGFYWTD